jgi:RNA polymerase sigma-70 factor, ECF subfamily
MRHSQGVRGFDAARLSRVPGRRRVRREFNAAMRERRAPPPHLRRIATERVRIMPQAKTVTAESEEALIARALRRDPEALAALMRRHNRRLYRAAWGILRDEQEAEDAVQESYLKAFAGLAKFRGEAALSTWLTRIVINEALMRRRKPRRLVLEDFENVVPLRAPGSSEPTVENPEGAAMRGQLRLYLESAVGDLPEEQRTVFVLRALEELSVEETAAVLDLNPQTVRTRFMRARRRLQSHLHEELKMTFGEMLAFDGARCDRLVARVLAKFQAAHNVPSLGTGED